MALRAGQLPFAATAAAADASLLRRAALWALLGGKLVGGWGVQWDIQWHVLIGRDSFWIPPHVMTYTGVALTVLVSFGMLAWETARGEGELRLFGLRGSRGFHLAAWGIGLTVLAAPIDDLWHRMFGLDVTLWSPPHLLGLVGSLINTLGCMLIIQEVYPPSSRLRLAAMLLAGALLYGNLHLMVDPSTRIAYLYGGVRFYTLAILSALLLPLALVTTARLTGRRWAPLGLIILVIVVGVIGQQLAREGFARLQPVSVIEAEIAKDPTSPIAVATLMARSEGRTPGQVGGLVHRFALIPALAITLVDARRRPVRATLAYAVTLFAMLAWLLPQRATLAPMAPGVLPTSLALLLTLAAALLGGLAARWLSDSLAGHPSPPLAGNPLPPVSGNSSPPLATNPSPPVGERAG
jgi:hypothetical protein